MKIKRLVSVFRFLLILQPLAFCLSYSTQALGQTSDSAQELRRDKQGRPPVVSLSSPNILFVSIDDFNDWGPSQLDREPFDGDTSNFDSLAAQAILFRNAHCNAPSYNRSRTSIMSGHHPASTGVYGNGYDRLVNERFDDILLLPEYFKKYGYATLGEGKIYHANQTSAADRKGRFSPRGWDDFKAGGDPMYLF